MKSLRTKGLLSTLLCLLVIFLLQAFLEVKLSYAAYEPPTKKVLILYADTQDFLAYPVFTTGFKARLGELMSEQIEYSYEYLAWSRHATLATYGDDLTNFLSRKYQQAQPDCVVLVGGSAAPFFLSHGEEIFPNVPKIVTGATLADDYKTTIPPNFTLLTTSFDVTKALELILQLQPATNKIYVVIGDSLAERRLAKQYALDFNRLSNHVDITFLNTLSFTKLIEKVRILEPNSVILFQTYFQDADGASYYPLNVLRLLYQASPVPIYATQDSFLGLGTVGGYVGSTRLLGIRAAELSAKLLNPQNSSEIELSTKETGEFIFDWRELKRWNLAEKALPIESKIEYKIPTFWESYQWYITGGIALVLLETLLVSLLLFNRSARKKGQQNIVELNSLLKENVQDLQNLNAALEEEIAERTHAEAMLSQNEQRLLAFLASIPDMSAILRRDGTILLIGINVAGEGAAYYQMYRDSQKFIGQKIYDSLPTTVATLFMNAIEKAVDRRGVETIEYQIDIDGYLRDRESRFISNNPDEVLFISKDTTAEKRELRCDALLHDLSSTLFYENTDEDILTLICERLVDIFHLSGAVIGIKNEDGTVSFIEYLKVPFLQKLRPQNMRWDDPTNPDIVCTTIRTETEQFIITQPDTISPEYMELTRLLNVEVAAAFPLQFDSKTIGALVVLEPQAKYWSDKTTMLLRGFARHVAAIIHATKAKERLNLLMASLNSAACGIAITNLDGTFEWINPAFTTMSGFSFEEVVGKHFSLLDKDRYTDVTTTDIWNSISKGTIHLEETYATHKNGTTYMEERIITPVRNKNGDITHVITIKTDISDRLKAAKIQLEAQAANAKAEKLYSLATLASGISHEISQPLNSIKMLSSSIEYANELGVKISPDDIIKHIGEISRQADRIRDIINHLRSFMRRDKVQLCPVSLNTAITESLSIVGKQLENHGITITLDLAEDLPAVRATLTGLEEIIVNLAVNAMQALQHTHQQEKSIVLRTRVTQEIVLEVSDNGPGINADIGRQLFEPFFSTKEHGENLGLGLSIVRSLVEFFDATITFESTLGLGTTFIVKFPRITEKVGE